MLFEENQKQGDRVFVVARGDEKKGVKSAYLTFDDASDTERGEHLNALIAAQSSNKGAFLDDEHKAKVAEVNAKFVRDRIKTAHGFEVRDGDQVRELQWPEDAARIFKLIPPGLVGLLRNTIDGLNFPRTVDTFENAAIVGSRELPNF